MIAKDVMKTNFIAVDKNDVISKLIGKFQVSKKTEAVVLDGKKYSGIVSKRKMLNKQLRIYEEKVKKLVMKPAVLTGGEDLAKVASLMNLSDVHMLPVIKGGMVKGVVYAIDVLKGLLPLLGERKVSDVSKGKVIAFDQHTEINKAMKLMRYRKIDRAPIVNGRNKLMGIISIVDLILKYSMFPIKRSGGKNIRQAKSSPGKERESSSVYVIHDATVDVVTATMDDRIKTVIGLMAKNNISDVVVIDEFNQPAGIVTIKDILKLF